MGSVVQRIDLNFPHQEKACQADYSGLVAVPAGSAAKTSPSGQEQFQFFHGKGPGKANRKIQLKQNDTNYEYKYIIDSVL